MTLLLYFVTYSIVGVTQSYLLDMERPLALFTIAVKGDKKNAFMFCVIL